MGETSTAGRGSVIGPVCGLALAAIAVALLSHHFIFPALSFNRDEAVYLWQVATIRDGYFLPPTRGFAQHFHPWLAGVRGDSFFSQYTLGWPLVLLVAEVVGGSAVGALALGAALTVVGTYLLGRELFDETRVPLIAALVMLTSPIVVIQSGTHLGYLFTLGLGLLFVTCVCSGVRTGRRGRIVVGGVLVGWIFMTRPFDAVLWGAAVTVALGWSHRREPRRLMRAAMALALGAVPLVVATLAYNAHVTGSFTQFPITAADPRDTFGFGLRGIMPLFAAADYTPVQAVRSSGKQAALLPLFLTGSYVLGGLALWGMWRGRREAAVRVLLAVAVAFPVGYFFFWGMFVSSPTMPLLGPIYYIPIFPVLALVGTRELVRIWEQRRRLAIGLVVGMVVLTVPVAAHRIDVNRRISESQIPWKDSTADAPDGSLVFQWRPDGYLMFYNPFARNTAEIDGPVIFAVDRGPDNFRLLDAYPERDPYLQRTSIPPIGEVPNDHPKTPDVSLTPIEILRAPVIELQASVHSGRMPTDARFFARMFGRVVHGWPAPDPSDPAAALRLGAGTPETEPDGSIDTYGMGDSTGTVTIGIGRGATPKQAARHPISRQDFHYRVVDGEVELLTPFDSFRRGWYGENRRWFTVAPGVTSPVSLDTIPVPLRK